MKIVPIILVLSSWAGWFALERWTNSVTELLDPIHPHLADAIIVILFALAGIIWYYDYTRNSQMKKVHSKTLSKAFEIMSKGEFKENINNEMVFHVPHPYREYLIYERMSKYSTPKDFQRLWDDYKDNMFTEQSNKFHYVELSKSNEASFQRAMKHLKSYKHIMKNFDKTKEMYVKFQMFDREHKGELQKIMDDRFKLREPTSHLTPKFDNLATSTNNNLEELRKSLEILSQQLEDGEAVKGKCELGY